MSADAMKWAKGVQAGGPGHKAVLLVLADYADERHSCYPGQQLLATITEQGERTVRRQLAQMEEAGLLRRESRSMGEGRGRTSDRFYLSVEMSSMAGKSEDRPSETPDLPATQNDQPAIDDRLTGQALAGDLLEIRKRTARGPNKPSPFPPPGAFLLTDAMKEWAAREAPNVDLVLQTKQFADHWRGKGEKRADWVATWRTWIRNAEQWNRSGRRGSPPPPITGTTSNTRTFASEEEYDAWKATQK